MRIGPILFLCLLQFSCTSQPEEKIKGISFVAARDEIKQTHIDPVIALHANYAAIMPYGFIRDLSDPEIIFDTDRQWFGETKNGAKQYIMELHKNGIKVMLKPHIWIWHGQFTGDMAMATEDDWKKLEQSYTDYVMLYAHLAEEAEVDILCIGTELEEFIKHRPQYWMQLIKKVRAVYKGKLTYAANWDEYPRTPFWRELDFIGIDAYFPLSDKEHPSMEEMHSGWQKWKEPMEAFSQTLQKPVLFTEFGYRSMDYSAHKPWLVDQNETEVNLDLQSEALRVTFEEFWQEDWFAGGFVWKWFINHQEVGGVENNRFTPQNKPAEETIRSYYQKL